MTQPNTNALATLQNKLAQSNEEHKALVVEEKFQEYKSSRSGARLITTGGIRITFTNFKLLTQNPDVIEYLDKEIKAGLPGITKGELLTLDEVNPMQTLRREMEAKVRAEFAEEAKQAALGNTRDMGASAMQALNPTSSKQVAG